ncbi:MAG: acyltransferase [Pseudomonadota bacterium]|nr:acyltransferase [Pseudomonadota bacterium]
MTKDEIRYVSLDGMRGLAAIIVALFHYNPTLAPGGYLAVDFFFVLSGFVLARNYSGQFAAGLTSRDFMITRLIRLYPLFACGVVIGTAFAVQGELRHSDDHLPIGQLLIALPLNLIMLPSPTDSTLFPVNAPAWSLFCEVLANLAMALVLVRLTPRTLALVALGSLIALLVAECVVQVSPAHLAAGVSVASEGDTWNGFAIAILRTAFSFTIGMLIAQQKRMPELPTSAWIIGCFLLLPVLLALPVPMRARFPFDLLVVALLSPLLVVMGSRFQPSAFLAPAATLTGEISYALYAVHLPVAHTFQFLGKKTGLAPATLALPYLLAALSLAWLSVKFIDKPMRSALTRFTRSSQTARHSAN